MLVKLLSLGVRHAMKYNKCTHTQGDIFGGHPKKKEWSLVGPGEVTTGVGTLILLFRLACTP